MNHCFVVDFRISCARCRKQKYRLVRAIVIDGFVHKIDTIIWVGMRTFTKDALPSAKSAAVFGTVFLQTVKDVNQHKISESTHVHSSRKYRTLLTPDNAWSVASIGSISSDNPS